MGMLVGIALCAFGIGAGVSFISFGDTLFAIVALVCLLAGIVVVILSYQKGRRQQSAPPQKQCPACRINVADGCTRCPRCGREL